MLNRTSGLPLTRAGGLPPVRRAAAPEQPRLPSSPELRRILRPEAAFSWLMPQLSQLTPTYIEQILRGALMGSPSQAWELFNLMEDTWPRLQKNVLEIKRAAINLNWSLEPWAEEDQPPTPDAEERASLVSHLLWTMRPDPAANENDFEDSLFDILDAVFKGSSVLEVDWEIRPTPRFGDVTSPRATLWAHPRNYAWGDDGRLGLTVSTDRFDTTYKPTTVEPFPENKFLIAISKARSGHPLQGSLLRPLAWWWCAANFSADWLLNLAQVFGLPFRWANYDTNASQDTVNAICAMLENMGSAGWAAFPAGTTLDLKEPGKTGDATPQAEMMDRADKQCDLLILGQTLTSDVGDSGSRALGDVHLSVRDEIILSAANFAAKVINRQLIPAILELNYGDSENAPEFRPEQRKQEDAVANANRDAVLIDKGIAIPRAWFYERHGIPLPQQGEEVITKPEPQPMQLPGFNHQPSASNNQPGDREPDLQANARADLARTLGTDLEPLRERLTKILRIRDDVIFAAKIRELKADLEGQLSDDLKADPATARVIEQLLAEGFTKGLS